MASNGTATPSSPPPNPTSNPSPSPSSPQPPSSSLTSPSAAPPTEPPSSTPVSLPPSSNPPSNPPSSSPAPPPSSSAPPPPSSAPPTSTVTAPSRQQTTQVITSVVTPTPTVPGESVAPSTLVVTVTTLPTDNQPSNTAGPGPSSSTSGPAGLQNVNKNSKGGGGLTTGGKTAIAVVVPVVVVALLVLAGIIFWRKRKQRQNAEEARRKEVEEYGYNPNNDPTLPAVGMTSEMAEDQSGYRGWGNTTTASSGRKASTTLASGMAYSDSTSNPGGPNSPTQAHSDNQSNDPLVNGRRETLDAEGIGALGAIPSANANATTQQATVHRGPSNASSSYSAAGHSDNSGDYPIPVSSHPQEYYTNDGYNAYSNNQYYNAYSTDQQPVIRDVSARRNTRIENPSVFPQQGNSGIAQNF